MAVLTALPAYRSSGASFLSFVYGIAAHKVMDFHRRNARDRSQSVSDVPEVQAADAGPEEQVLRREAGRRLYAMLGELSEMQRQVLILRLVVGLSVSETAEIVSASPGAVRVCQHRALARLRRQLDEFPSFT
jgi:RNA polymerase sigma-70 factor (ECF subfamily)